MVVVECSPAFRKYWKDELELEQDECVQWVFGVCLM